METDMKMTESKESQSSWWDSRISPKNSKPLAKHLVEMGENVKQMLRMIDGESLSKKAEMHRPELVAHTEEFYHLYQSLTECYDHLTGELQKNIPLDLQLQGSGNSKSGSSQSSPLLTPDQKLGLHNPGRQSASSSSGGSSDFSLKEGTELSSSSSSDSESESSNSINIYAALPANIDGKDLHEKIAELGTKLPSMKEKHQVAEKDNADSLLEVGENGSYEKLLGRVINYEEKLRVSNLRLQFSEEEVAKLKSELHAQTESAKREIKMREGDLEMERRQVFELRNYTTKLETHVSESNFKIEKLMKEHEVSRERLKESDEEIEQLKNENFERTHQLQGQLKLAQEDVVILKASLDSERRQILKLQDRIAKYQTDLSDHDDKIRELKVAFSDAERNFSLERAQLQSDVVSLVEKQNLSDARLNELELQGKALEDKLNQCENEKMEMKGLHEAQQSGMQSEISRLKVEVSERGSFIESLNKNLDSLQLKYDMLMAEKDGVNAKVSTLIAEVSSRDDCIRGKEEMLEVLRMDKAQLIARAGSAEKLVDELRVRVKELKKEVERQINVILDGAEEKREAIRQLCFSLEHYRSGYKELRQAFIGYKRNAVVTA